MTQLGYNKSQSWSTLRPPSPLKRVCSAHPRNPVHLRRRPQWRQQYDRHPDAGTKTWNLLVADSITEIGLYGLLRSLTSLPQTYDPNTLHNRLSAISTRRCGPNRQPKFRHEYGALVLEVMQPLFALFLQNGVAAMTVIVRKSGGLTKFPFACSRCLLASAH